MFVFWSGIPPGGVLCPSFHNARDSHVFFRFESFGKAWFSQIAQMANGDERYFLLTYYHSDVAHSLFSSLAALFADSAKKEDESEEANEVWWLHNAFLFSTSLVPPLSFFLVFPLPLLFSPSISPCLFFSPSLLISWSLSLFSFLIPFAFPLSSLLSFYFYFFLLPLEFLARPLSSPLPSPFFSSSIFSFTLFFISLFLHPSFSLYPFCFFSLPTLPLLSLSLFFFRLLSLPPPIFLFFFFFLCFLRLPALFLLPSFCSLFIPSCCYSITFRTPKRESKANLQERLRAKGGLWRRRRRSSQWRRRSRWSVRL